MQMAPWLNHYDQGIPETLAPYPDRTLLDDVADAVAERPGGPALLFKGRTVTWGELEQGSDAFAAALAGRGVAPGDRVALLLPNCPQFLICELGAWKAGAILVPLNPIYQNHAPPSPGSSPPTSRNTCRRSCGCCSPWPRSARTATG
jgi:long-chain acyl-CoA synthetase